MSQKNIDDTGFDSGLPVRNDAPPMQPMQPTYPSQAPYPAQTPQQMPLEQRSRILKAPLNLDDTLNKLR